MHTGKSRRNPKADEAAFKAWQSEGTIQLACLKLKKDGIINIQGRSFSPDGVRKAAVRHMVYNYDDSKQYLKKSYENTGYAVEDEYIERLLIRMAVSALINQYRIKGWLVEHGLIEKHKLFIASLVALPND